jgi:hypothetical protein
MTRLQEEIRAEIDKIPLIENKGFDTLSDDYDGYAKAAAEIAKTYIEKAWNEAWGQSFIRNNAMAKYVAQENGITLTPKTKDEWMKENGVL